MDTDLVSTLLVALIYVAPGLWGVASTAGWVK